MTTQSLGRAHDVSIVGDEDGFELHIDTDEGTFVVNVHSVTKDLISVGDALTEYWAEGLRAAREYRPLRDDADAYDVNDPKHPGWSVGV